MVLHHITHNAAWSKIAAAFSDTLGFAGVYLNRFDVGIVPQGIKQRIGKAEYQNILYRFFCQIVVVTENMRLVEVPDKVRIQFNCRA